MTAREVIAYAITHAPPGVKGGPYEGAGAFGESVPTLALAYRYENTRNASPDAAWLRNSGHPARVIRIVRARPSAEPTQQPSDASAVEVLRELVAWVDSNGGAIAPIVDGARRVLAAVGPDPMPVVRAAMAWGLACKRHGGRQLDLEITTLEAVDAYRKAGGTP